MSISDTQPLLRGSRRVRRASVTDNAFDRILLRSSTTQDRYLHPARKQVRRFLTSKYGHYSVLGLVSLDVSCIFTDFLISLYVCEHTCGSGSHVSKGILNTQTNFNLCQKNVKVRNLSLPPQLCTHQTLPTPPPSVSPIALTVLVPT